MTDKTNAFNRFNVTKHLIKQGIKMQPSNWRKFTLAQLAELVPLAIQMNIENCESIPSYDILNPNLYLGPNYPRTIKMADGTTVSAIKMINGAIVPAACKLLCDIGTYRYTIHGQVSGLDDFDNLFKAELERINPDVRCECFAHQTLYRIAAKTIPLRNIGSLFRRVLGLEPALVKIYRSRESEFAAHDSALLGNLDMAMSDWFDNLRILYPNIKDKSLVKKLMERIAAQEQCLGYIKHQVYRDVIGLLINNANCHNGHPNQQILAKLADEKPEFYEKLLASAIGAKQYRRVSNGEIYYDKVVTIFENTCDAYIVGVYNMLDKSGQDKMDNTLAMMYAKSVRGRLIPASRINDGVDKIRDDREIIAHAMQTCPMISAIYFDPNIIDPEFAVTTLRYNFRNSDIFGEENIIARVIDYQKSILPVIKFTLPMLPFDMIELITAMILSPLDNPFVRTN
jgi:hypothetical protein